MTRPLTPARPRTAILAKAELIADPRTRWLGGPTLAVADPETGRTLRLPVATVELDGAEYLVSPDGETDWVRDLRVLGTGALRHGRTSEPIRATEVVGDRHDRVVIAYRDQMGERTSEPFDALPDPADHPVFLIEPEA